MAKYVIEDTTLINMADAIREKTGGTEPITTSNFATEIAGIESGGDTTMEDGLITRTLTEYSNDRVTSVGSYAFYNNKTLESIDLPSVSSIENYVFYKNTSLKNVNLPLLSDCTGANSSFYECTALETINLPKIKFIPKNMFYGCSFLKECNFPELVTIEDYAFNKCSSLEELNFQTLIALNGSGNFKSCTSLISINMPNVTYIPKEAFSGCTKLTNLDMTQVITIGESAFYNCTSLTEINAPFITTINNKVFSGCSGITKAILPKVTNILSEAFKSTALQTLILNSETMCSLDNTNAFTSTPIASGTGYIYVPSALIEEYKAATNWVTYADQFRAIEDYPEICGEVTQ